MESIRRSLRRISIFLRLRVTNVLKTWLGKKHSYDLEESSVMIDRIQQFVRVIRNSGFVSQADLIQKTMEKLGQQQDLVPSTAPPKPLLPNVPLGPPAFIIVTDIDPLEMARQICLIEYDLLKAIIPKECLGQAWAKSGKESRSPHVLRMIYWTNELSGWVSTEIMRRDTPKARADVLKYFIKLAKHCKDLNNFNAVFEIVAALQNSAVDRIKKSWEKLEKATKLIHAELVGVTSNTKNFATHRELLRKSLPPCIPYLGMYLTDLTMIDTTPDFTKNPFDAELINFDKLRKTALVIKQIQLFQHTGYSLEVVPQIRDYLLTVKERNMSEEDAFKMSLVLEPRATAQT